MSNLMSLFGSLLLVYLAVAGLLFMVAPGLGRQLLKNTGIAVGLFVLGMMVLQACCSALRG